MNKEIYFETTLSIGTLYLNKVFNTFEDEPIVFVCVDDKRNYYFCICYELRGALKWIINPISVYALSDIITRNITLYEGITYGENDKIECVYSEHSGEQYRWIKKGELNDNILPTPYVRLDADISLEECTNYLMSLNKSLCDRLEPLNSVAYGATIRYNSQIYISTDTEGFVEQCSDRIRNYQSHYPDVEPPFHVNIVTDIYSAA